MKVSVKKIDELRREMSFVVPKERVVQRTNEVLAEITKHAKIPGFRPGKAPKHLVEAAHGKTSKEEMLKNLIPEVYQEGLTAEKLLPIDFPMIDKVELKEGSLTFRATIDLRPEFDVDGYTHIKITKKSPDVTEAELDKTLEFFKKGRGMEENAVIDDTFAKSVGFPTLEEFKKALKRNLEFDKERQNRVDVENQLIEQLLTKCDFPVPQSMVDRQLQGRIDEFKDRLKKYGAKEEAIAKKLEEAMKELRDAAQKDVKTFLILQKIAEKENISPAKNENVTMKVIEFLLKEAQWEEGKQ